MKRVVLLIVCGACLSSVGTANPGCITGSLASYEALGATGCMIGTNLVSSFTTLSGITGATKLLESVVSITPSGGTTNPELLFNVSATASSGQLFETIFTYRISGNPYGQSQISLSKSSETGDGAVTDIQNLCVDGNFGPDGVTGCNGSSAPFLLTLDGVQNTDQTALTALSFLSVTDDFTLDGGLAGSSTGGTFTDQFTAVPEPKFAALLAAFVLALAATSKRG